jgi:hypothetical protein
MATSPNFGWLEPDNTDLVKNGALAIRTAVNAIDSSMGDLLGGTTGQVLSKNSNTSMDFTWVTTDDANAIQNAIVDAKGDLIAASANDTPARLAVGNNGETLVADSSTSTGLKWEAKSGPAFLAYRYPNQTTTQNAYTKIQLNYETYDTANCFDPTTNYRFTPNISGYYQLNAICTPLAGTNFMAIFKNGSEFVQFGRNISTTASASGGIIMYFNGTTDYAELYIYTTSASGGVEGVSQTTGTLFSGVWIRY